MTRRRALLLFLPALLILLLTGAFAWLMHTEPGARWIWQRVVGLVPDDLRVEQLSGDLQSGLQLRGLEYRAESLSFEADVVTLRLDLDFWPPAVSVGQLDAGTLSLRSYESPPDPAAPAPAAWLPQLALPVPVRFEQARLGRLTWYGAAQQPQVDLQDLSFVAYWFDRLELDNISVRGGGSRGQGTVEIGLRAPHVLALDAAGTLALPLEGEPAGTIEWQARARGDLERSRWELEVAQPQINLTAELNRLLTRPEWDLQLIADRLQWPLPPAVPELTLEGVSASSYGTAEDYGLEIETVVEAGGVPAMHTRMVGTGNRGGLVFEVLDVAADEIEIDGSGRIDWQHDLQASAELQILRFNPRDWLAPWGEAPPLTGTLVAAWSDQLLRFDVRSLTAPGTVDTVTGTVAIAPGEGTLAADLSWRNLAWPPGAGEPNVVSPEGRLALEGRPDDWTVDGELQLGGRGVPTGRLQARGGGDRTSMHLTVPQAAALDGSLAGELDLTWSPRVRWSLQARLDDVATAPLVPAWPGRLSGEFAAEGRTGPAALDVRIGQLSGVIRERPVSARGDLSLFAGAVTAKNLWLRSGASELKMDGRLDGLRGLAVEARVAALGDFLDGAAGSLVGQGNISLDPAQPSLQLRGRGQNLSWAGVSLESLVMAPADGAPGTRLELEGLELGGNRFDRVVATFTGERPLDDIALSAEWLGSRIETLLRGGVADWTSPLASGWRGQLQRLRLHAAEAGFIELESPAGLSLNTGMLALDAACFLGSREGRLCIDSHWQSGDEFALEAAVDALSPNLALTLLGSDLAFTQRLSGELEWRQRPQSEPRARVRLGISPGQVTTEEGEETVITTGAGLFGFEIADGRLYSGNLDIPVPGSGGIDTDFTVPDLSAGLESSVQGRIRIQLASIEPLLRLFPGVEGSSGPLSADMNFSGTLSDPRLTGHASLVRGTVSHFASGLVLEDIRLAGAVYQYDQTELTGTFRAGEGQGTARMVVNFDDILAPELSLELSGRNLALVNVPDLNLIADPDLRLIWREGELGVIGRIVVPRARLSPRYLPTTTAAESADVVIVAGADPLAEPAESKPVDWKVRGQLELELGDDVRLILERATARAQGKTTFHWSGPLMPLADGGFGISGEISAYGQLLRIAEGRVNFSNRPADNPFLNIRAEREIYGNSQVTRAGVLVTGTLKRPIMEPYSVPMTTRERALTLLATGSDFNYEQGVGSVEVGMYVAPKLYISYGIGLFDEQNVISARYDLGKGWGIKTTSGQRETGADISYTIEH
jgi:translocation and assembly module TamB